MSDILTQFFRSYLFAYQFMISFPLGMLALAMLHYLTGGNWGYPIRRILASGARTLWLAALLFIPIAIGIPYLYPWAGAEASGGFGEQHGNPLYLNPPFFIIRAVIYFAIWILLARGLTRRSEDPEAASDPFKRRRLQRLSAFGLILYILTVTFASIDWMMSLETGWFSTIFGLLIVTGQALTAAAFAILILPRVRRSTGEYDLLPTPILRDLGAVLLTSVMTWAYIAYSQLVIVWAGNIPREAAWYVARSTGGWQFVAIFMALFQFALPFLALLTRLKGSKTFLNILGSSVLAARLVENFWLIAPAFTPGRLRLTLFDLVLPAALMVLWWLVFRRTYERTPEVVKLDDGIRIVEPVTGE